MSLIKYTASIAFMCGALAGLLLFICKEQDPAWIAVAVLFAIIWKDILKC